MTLSYHMPVPVKLWTGTRLLWENSDLGYSSDRVLICYLSPAVSIVCRCDILTPRLNRQHITVQFRYNWWTLGAHLQSQWSQSNCNITIIFHRLTTLYPYPHSDSTSPSNNSQPTSQQPIFGILLAPLPRACSSALSRRRSPTMTFLGAV